MKEVSVHILDITDSQNLTILRDAIVSTFIQANTKEHIYTCCGTEFDKREKSITIIVCTLYGLTISVERFRMMLANFLNKLRLVTSHFGRDIWIQLRDTKD